MRRTTRTWHATPCPPLPTSYLKHAKNKAGLDFERRLYKTLARIKAETTRGEEEPPDDVEAPPTLDPGAIMSTVQRLSTFTSIGKSLAPSDVLSQPVELGDTIEEFWQSCEEHSDEIHSILADVVEVEWGGRVEVEGGGRRRERIGGRRGRGGSLSRPACSGPNPGPSLITPQPPQPRAESGRGVQTRASQDVGTDAREGSQGLRW